MELNSVSCIVIFVASRWRAAKSQKADDQFLASGFIIAMLVDNIKGCIEVKISVGIDNKGCIETQDQNHGMLHRSVAIGD